MVRGLPNLNALKAFEAAARHVSFSRAAEELNVSHAAISRHVKGLEARLRAKLFVRTGRGVELTEAGADLARDLGKGFDILATATSRFARPARRMQRLTISSDPSFAALWLVPRLGRFTALHPAIELIVDPTPRLVDFGTEDVDLGIRYGAGPWRGIDAEKIADARLTVVCSPSLLKRSAVKRPAELPGGMLIQEAQKEGWQAWLEAAGIADRVVPSGPTLNGDLAIAAAEAGQGFALADQIQAGEALIARRLISPFDIVVSRYAYHLVRSAGVAPSKGAMAFRAWLRTELATTEAELAFATPADNASRRNKKQALRSRSAGD